MDSWGLGHLFGALVLPKWLQISKNAENTRVIDDFYRKYFAYY